MLQRKCHHRQGGKDYRAALPEAAIYVYDNNSTDGTDEIARAAGAVVRYERRQGKGNVIRTMFREIDAECYLMIDGDDTYPAEDARAMADGVLRDGYDMVIGDRLSSTYFTENKRPFHNSGNVLVRKLVNRFFRRSCDRYHDRIPRVQSSVRQELPDPFQGL